MCLFWVHVWRVRQWVVHTGIRLCYPLLRVCGAAIFFVILCQQSTQFLEVSYCQSISPYYQLMAPPAHDPTPFQKNWRWLVIIAENITTEFKIVPCYHCFDKHILKSYIAGDISCHDHIFPERFLQTTINQMEVSWNRGTPKSSILVSLFFINHPLWEAIHLRNPPCNHH